MASSSSPCLSLSSPSSGNWDYDIFPSFHGADVRNNFLSHVLKEFTRKGIDLFIDNEIKRGEFIGPELRRAIKGSKIALVLLSKNYASSSWCLDELVEIMKKKESGQIVIPIFYKVEPIDVRKQIKHFGKVFKKSCEGKDKEKTKAWSKALEGVANIAGYHSSARVDEASMIEKIAADISDMLNHSTSSRDFENFVGMDNHVERLNWLLRLDLDEVRMIGIWGPSGIGKTTIVRFLFNKFSSRFQHSALMVDIRCSYPYPKLCFDEHKAKLQLQNEMLTKMINHRDTIVSHLGVAQNRLRNKKVLLVLDDVDRLAQLDALAGNVEWFGPGSRIIITTENRRLLKAIGINHIYKVGFPSFDEALEMFCLYAFHKKFPEDGFYELACEITYLVGKLPLGLEVMGSYFRGLCKDKDQWLKEVSRLRRTNLDKDIEKILKFSYDALCDDYKDLFLHIACFFNRVNINVVEKYLAKKFMDLNRMLYVLEDKSLIKILVSLYNKDVSIEMHQLLAQLGQEIVLKESVREPWNRQFLNEYKDVFQILTDSTTITRSVFEGTFRVVYDSGHPIIINWSFCPFTSLDFTNNLEFLVELSLSCSKLETLWNRTKLLRNLKLLDLSGSLELMELPNLSMATNLEELYLQGCSSLVELPSSVGNATSLQKLNLEGCSSLVKLPSSIGNATNLQELNLERCSSLVELPSSIGNATNLRELNLKECSSLVELPSSIWNATYIRELNLDECSSLVKLPANIGNATNLRKLNLYRCSSLVELPSCICDATNLRECNLQECSSMVELPASIGNATNLRKLDLFGCSSLMELPYSIGNATNLKEINLEGCSSLVKLPSSIGNATNLDELNLEGCSSLVNLPASIGNATKLWKLNLKGCSSLISLPQLPKSLSILYVENCKSLEKLDSSFFNGLLWLDFINCFNLNKEARDIIIQSSTEQGIILPGKEVPTCFTFRASGSSVIVKLIEKHLPSSTKFKACILVNDNRCSGHKRVSFIITSNGITAHSQYIHPLDVRTEHLYIFDFEAEVTSTELDFTFKFDSWFEVKECGVLPILGP